MSKTFIPKSRTIMLVGMIEAWRDFRRASMTIAAFRNGKRKNVPPEHILNEALDKEDQFKPLPL
jgi:hypothetical protein